MRPPANRKRKVAADLISKIGGHKLIDDDHGCSRNLKELRDLEDAMDRIIGTDRWIGDKELDRDGPFGVHAMEPPFDADRLVGE